MSQVAAKLLAPDLDADRWRRRWTAQAELVAGLGGEGCISAASIFLGAVPHRAGAATGPARSLYAVTPWVPGRTFAAWCADGSLGMSDRTAVLADLARTVERLGDRGIVHRDLSPGNVIVDGTTATVIDFGIAIRVGDDVRSDRHLGTEGFAAPETSGGTWSPAADRWSFGALCRLAVGPGDNESVHRFIDRLLSDRPDDRPPPTDIPRTDL